MSSQNEDETVEDKIDDLEDQIHDLQIDLRDAYKTITKLEEQLSAIEEKHEEQLNKTIEEIVETLAHAQENEREATARADEYLKQMRTHDQNILNVLCMAESIRQKNYSFFETAEGRKTLDWADQQLQVLKHKWRL